MYSILVKMRSNLAKQKRFLLISESFNNVAEIKPISNQSIQILLPCGCAETQNLYCGRPTVKEDSLKYNELQSARFQYFEFCLKHKI